MEYNSTAKNQIRLKEVSLDEFSGIQTMVSNMSKPSNIVIESAVIEPITEFNEPVKTIEILNELPSVNVTLIPRQEVKQSNSIAKTINNLNDKQKSSIIFGLLGFSIILIAIAIFK